MADDAIQIKEVNSLIKTRYPDLLSYLRDETLFGLQFRQLFILFLEQSEKFIKENNVADAKKALEEIDLLKERISELILESGSGDNLEIEDSKTRKDGVRYETLKDVLDHLDVQYATNAKTVDDLPETYPLGFSVFELDPIQSAHGFPVDYSYVWSIRVEDAVTQLLFPHNSNEADGLQVRYSFSDNKNIWTDFELLLTSRNVGRFLIEQEDNSRTVETLISDFPDGQTNMLVHPYSGVDHGFPVVLGTVITFKNGEAGTQIVLPYNEEIIQFRYSSGNKNTWGDWEQFASVSQVYSIANGLIGAKPVPVACAWKGNWTSSGNYGRAPEAIKDQQGVVHVAGYLENGSTAYNQVVFNVPAGYRPKTDVVGIAQPLTDGTHLTPFNVRLKTNGDCIVLSGNAQVTGAVHFSVPPFIVA
ncbi:hypothetical protein [Listeria booriae]|uniref:hypothetical protein n=1 Tax=Listeria booriae TaxID=1552123 RepID=UPI0016243DD8|nr:hypothetical protein [Listeria booriae]MBC1892416.1 hypothetical protein [Listeria booriae]